MSLHRALQLRLCQRTVAATVVAIGVMLIATSGALADEHIAIDIRSVDDTRFPEVDVYFTADAPAGPLVDLSPGELQASEGGSPATVESLDRASEAGIPLALILAIDVSGSMEGEPIAQARQAAISLVESLSPGDAVAVIAFAGEAQVVQPLDEDLSLAVEALNSLSDGGDTALYGAVSSAATLAAESGRPRTAVVLLSDGADFGGVSGVDRDDAIAAVAGANSVFYSIGFGPEIDLEFLQSLATQGNGEYFAAPGPEAIGDIFGTIEDVLRSQYVARLVSSAAPGSVERDVVLSITRGEQEGEAEVPYVSRQPAPTPSPISTSAAPTAAPTAALTPTPSPAPQTDDDEDGSLPLAILVLFPALVLGAVVAGGVAWFVRRRRAAERRRRDAEIARQMFIERASEMDSHDSSGDAT